MKLIHLISGGDVGGAKTHVLSLLNGLRKEHQVLLVCFMEGPFAQEARDLGIPTEVMPGRNLFAIRNRLAERIGAEKFDLVHCHGSRANLIGYLLKGRIEAPVITTIHSDPKLDYLGRPLSNLTYGMANRRALKHLDGWVCVSRQLRDMQVTAGRDPSRTFVINNGVDFSNIQAPVPREAFWKQQGLEVGENSVVFGIAARIAPVKDIGSLIRAFAEAVAQEPGIRLAIAGDGEQRRELEQLADKLCPKGTVRFMGWLTDTDSFYNALDVNMLTSLSEGLPYAIPEGARMSCATIATRVGAVPTIVVDNETGFLVEPGDVETLTERMLRVARDEGLRKRLGRAIFEKVRREFSVEATVRTQVQIYETILRRYRRSKSECKDGVLICGAYGKGNIGDETILESILQQLRSMDEDLPICVLSKMPRRTARQSNVRSIYTFSYFRLHRELRRVKLFISGGGSLIQDVTSTRSLLFYLHCLRWAHKRDCKVMMYGCGIGPVNRKRNRRRAARVIDACVDLITLRDPESERELRELGVSRPVIRVTADPALLQTVSLERQQMYEEYRKKAGIEKDGSYCLFALRPWNLARRKTGAFAAAAEYVYRQYGMTPVFFLLEPGKDREITQTVADMVHCPKLVLPPLEDGGMICALMRQMKMVVSMRLHALIFASGQGVPVVGVAYDPKVTGFMDYLGQENYVSLEEATDGTLCDCIDSAATSEAAEQEIVGRLRQLAGRNGQYAWQLLSGDPLE
ncbi:MAG: polysaccharide pyruvyl transferase CsaB [Candidatus Faecousia sp.]|nr:polysaccharide pyruvyl transferase CsaB [Candidatus Faecousia sp.]